MNNDYFSPGVILAAQYREHLATQTARYDAALQIAGAAHAVVFSGSQKFAFLDDMPYPFKPNPHFVAWLPLTQLPLSYVVYTPGQTPRLIYFQPHDYWHVVPDAPEGFWVEGFDIRIVHTLEEIAQHLPADRPGSILIGEIDDDAHRFGIERVNPSTAINVLHYARGRKTDYELSCMRAASVRGAKGHLAAESAFRNGASELEIHRAYCAANGHTDNDLPYGNIVALNEHGAVLHYTLFDQEPPAESRSFLIDAGASVGGYAADITRTYAQRDSRFTDLIACMDKLQQALVADVRAGVSYVDLHLSMHTLLTDVLRDGELASGSSDALIETGVTRAFLPHGLGHLLGLQVHDVGGFMVDDSGHTLAAPDDHPYLRLTRELETDMVLTIEPGLYVIDMLLDELRGTDAEPLLNQRGIDWLRPFGGIRIEDNVRVTSAEPENLTRDAFAIAA